MKIATKNIEQFSFVVISDTVSIFVRLYLPKIPSLFIHKD
jgi:hypothetical protein